MGELSSGHLAVKALKGAGIEHLFTLSGGHLFPLYDGCRHEGVRLIDTRHEQTAVFAAEGLAKLTRTPQVAALTAGPGVTNGMSAVATARLGGSPVVLGGRAPQGTWGQGNLQEIDHVAFLSAVTKHAATSTAPEGVGRDVLHAPNLPHPGPRPGSGPCPWPDPGPPDRDEDDRDRCEGRSTAPQPAQRVELAPDPPTPTTPAPPALGSRQTTWTVAGGVCSTSLLTGSRADTQRWSSAACRRPRACQRWSSCGYPRWS